MANKLEIDYSSLRRFCDQLELLQSEFPELCRDLSEEISEEVKRTLDSAISTSVNDSHGHIRSWQEAHVGSLGRYAAVRVNGRKTYRNYSAALITNALESGASTRRPGGNAKRYVPRITKGRISPRKFYTRTFAKVESYADTCARRFAEDLAGRFERM